MKDKETQEDGPTGGGGEAGGHHGAAEPGLLAEAQPDAGEKTDQGQEQRQEETNNRGGRREVAGPRAIWIQVSLKLGVRGKTTVFRIGIAHACVKSNVPSQGKQGFLLLWR